MTIQLKGPAGQDMGSATLTEAPHGLVLRVTAKGLTPGWHGLHSDAVTRRGAQAILALALPMNVRFCAQLAAQAQLGQLRIAWAPVSFCLYMLEAADTATFPHSPASRVGAG